MREHRERSDAVTSAAREHRERSDATSAAREREHCDVGNAAQRPGSDRERSDAATRRNESTSAAREQCDGSDRGP